MAQIESPWRNLLLIAFMGLLGGYITAANHGEIHHFSDFPKVFNDAALYAVFAIVTWIFSRSPWAKLYQQLTQQQSATTTTMPSGAVVEKKVTTTIETKLDTEAKK